MNEKQVKEQAARRQPEDRLAEIEENLEQNWDLISPAQEDRMRWLIEEVKRLRTLIDDTLVPIAGSDADDEEWTQIGAAITWRILMGAQKPDQRTSGSELQPRPTD